MTEQRMAILLKTLEALTSALEATLEAQQTLRDRVEALEKLVNLQQKVLEQHLLNENNSDWLFTEPR